MVLHAYKNATPEEKKRFDAIYAKKRQDKTKEEIDFIRAMIDKYGGLEYAQKVADTYEEKAKVTVEKYKKLIPQNEYTPIMMAAIEELYKRKK